MLEVLVLSLSTIAILLGFVFCVAEFVNSQRTLELRKSSLGDYLVLRHKGLVGRLYKLLGLE